MPASRCQLTVADASRTIAAAARRAPGDPGDLVGVELEWIVIAGDDPRARVALGAVDDELVTRSLPGRGRVTFEPGGQLELSSLPYRGVGAACSAAAVDAETLGRRLRRRGITLVGLGLDPVRTPQRAVHHPRYDAMETYFDGFGPAGRTMMCSTAALQINVGVGGDERQADRSWQLAHLAGPALAAAFANSPLARGRPSGWRSARLGTWLAMDNSRTAPVTDTENAPPDPGQAWVQYALDARVMLVRERADSYVPVAIPMTLRQWVDQGSPWGWPEQDDIEYHLTTLFPPVRPRGWLELRMIDALPDPWWRVAVAVAVSALDPRVANDVAACCRPVAGRWREAARHGLSHPDLASAAQRLFLIAADVAPDLGTDAETLDALAEFADRYPAHRRGPADDRIDEWMGTGAYFPPERPPRERTWT